MPIVAGQVNTLAAGVQDGILLTPSHSGTAEAPTVIQGAVDTDGNLLSVIQPQSPLICGIYAASDQKVDYITIRDVIIEDASEHGISFAAGSSHITIQRCVVRNNGIQGIAFHGTANLIIEDCVVTGNGGTGDSGKHGMYGGGTGHIIRRNVVANNSGGGIQVRPTVTNCRILDNIVSGNPLYDGIHLEGNSNPSTASWVNGNRCTGNLRGIQLRGAAGERCLNNICIGNTNNSIVIYWQSPGPVYYGGNVVDQALEDELGRATLLPDPVSAGDLVLTPGDVVSGSGASVSNGTAGASISAGQPLYRDAGGTLRPCTVGTAVAANCVGIALHGASAGQPVKYQTTGLISLGSVLEPGSIAVLSPDAAGAIRLVAGIGGYSTCLGVAVSASQLRLALVASGAEVA